MLSGCWLAPPRRLQASHVWRSQVRDEHIKFEKTAGSVARVRLDRSDKNNAITEAMYHGLRKAIEASEYDPGQG
jgi:enoyl-CoA hydratase/carnithine racemase